MITTRTSVLALVLALSQTGVVSAASTMYTDVYNAGGTLLQSNFFGPNDSDSWTFDITDDGYDPALESISSATVSLDLRDDAGFFFSYDLFWEKARLTSGSDLIDIWKVNTGTKVITITSLASLSSTGMLSMTLEAKLGDFYFDQATLNAEAVSAIPVPAAAWLFGSGLIGLAGFARAKHKA